MIEVPPAHRFRVRGRTGLRNRRASFYHPSLPPKTLRVDYLPTSFCTETLLVFHLLANFINLLIELIVDV